MQRLRLCAPIKSGCRPFRGDKPHSHWCPPFIKDWLFGVVGVFGGVVGMALAQAQVKNVTPMNETLFFGGPSELGSEGALGSLQISGAFSGLVAQENTTALNTAQNSTESSNAFLIVQKNTGTLQYLLQAGHYTLHTLGAKTDGASGIEKNSFGPIPHAYVSLNPNEHWSLAVGKLLAMPGFENPFTYQNQNIQRGVLENQNNTITQGIQLNYTDERSTLFWTLNDGFYSGQLKWMGAGGSYKFNARHSTNVMLGGAYQTSKVNTDVTPRLQNNSQIFNLVHTLKMGPWTLTPYYQYTKIPSSENTGLASAASTQGYALIINHQGPAPSMSFMPRPGTLNLPLRLEHIKASDYRSVNAQELVFGPGSEALAVTFTPTLQSGVYYARGEWSWLKAKHTSMLRESRPGAYANSQSRILLELGILY